MRTLRIVTPILAVLLAITGCSKSSKPTASNEADTASPQLPPPPITELAPSDVLADVDGTKLMVADTEAEMEYQLSTVGDRIPPERLPAAKDQIRRTIVDQFVMKQLLLNEAIRKNITVTKEDEDKAYEQIKANLPPGKTVEDMLKRSPIGEERTREEIKNSIKINKLFEECLATNTNIPEEEISKFCEKYKDSMSMPETVHARHILISSSSNDTEVVKAEQKKLAENVQVQLVGGSNFVEMAKQYSGCPSKEEGGDLGTFPRDRMVKQFSDAAFAQEVNAIGPVVETKFGYHIIQVLEHNSPQPVSRERAIEVLKNHKLQLAARSLIEELRSKAKITYGQGMTPMPPPPMPAGEEMEIQ